MHLDGIKIFQTNWRPPIGKIEGMCVWTLDLVKKKNKQNKSEVQLYTTEKNENR